VRYLSHMGWNSLSMLFHKTENKTQEQKIKEKISRQDDRKTMIKYLSNIHRHKTKCTICDKICLNKKDKQKHIDEQHRI